MRFESIVKLVRYPRIDSTLYFEDHSILFPTIPFVPKRYSFNSHFLVTHGHYPGVSDRCDVSSFLITPPLRSAALKLLSCDDIGDRIF